jgi:hypothetical protein
MKIKILIAALMLCSSTTYAEENKHPWGQMAEMDLSDIYQTMNEHHMGPIDQQNPTYKVNMDKAYKIALLKTSQVKTFGGYQAVIRLFIDSFQDSHVASWPVINYTNIEWPGFVSQMSNINGQDVYKIKNKADWLHNISIGDEILKCDDQTPSQLYDRNVQPYYGVDSLHAATVSYSKKLFLYENNPFVTKTATCTFKGNDGEYQQQLEWRNINLADWKEYFPSREKIEFKVVEYAPEKFWITIPTFYFPNQKYAHLQEMIQKLKDTSLTMRNAKTIVFDVRQNGGGDSSWADQIVNAIWGEGFTNRAYRKQFEGIDYRVSEDNIKLLEFYRDQYLKLSGSQGDEYKYLSDLVKGLRKAKSKGINSYSLREGKVVNDPIKPGEVKPKVFLFSDNSCGSSCLDLADTILSIPEAVHVGGETYADAAYIDNRGKTLSSGVSEFTFSMKVYRGRYRGHNVAYKPSIIYPHDDWTTQAIQTWFNEEVDP